MNTVPSSFTPSKYQVAIFDFIEREQGNLVIDACAGSGKSTTLVEAAKRLPTNCKALFVAFNKHIATPLGEKLRAQGVYHVEASTIHSLGNRLLGKSRIDDKKYRDLCKAYLVTHMPQNYLMAKHTAQLQSIIKFARLTMTTPTESNLLTMIMHYNLEIDYDDLETWPVLRRGVAPVIASGRQMYQTAKVIDFDDMVCLPVELDLANNLYDVVMVDECQDLNKAQLELVTRVCKRTGRMVFCGDKFQSLYGFTGADTESMKNIIKRTSATVLPLSICYRCPSSHIEVAAQVYKGIEPSPDAKRGDIQVIPSTRLLEMVKPRKDRDLIICRTTAPLVSQCLALLRNGIHATVRGKDIGKSLLDIVEKLKKSPSFRLETLAELITAYREQQTRILSAIPDNELQVESLNDKIDTLLALLEAYLASEEFASIVGFYDYVQGFFSDDTGDVVMLSTVHKAKGLEYDNVYILRSDLFPHPAAKKAWQIEQEYNIEYVALTRAKQALYFVGSHPQNITLVSERIAAFFEALATYVQETLERPTGLADECSTVEGEDTLIDTSVKSKRGGKRGGAGRKKNSEKGIAHKAYTVSMSPVIMDAVKQKVGERKVGQFFESLVLASMQTNDESSEELSLNPRLLEIVRHKVGERKVVAYIEALLLAQPDIKRNFEKQQD